MTTDAEELQKELATMFFAYLRLAGADEFAATAAAKVIAANVCHLLAVRGYTHG